MRRSAQPLAILMLTAAPLLMGMTTPRCDELLDQASAELRREQYPTMLTLAQQRQLLCPGADSSFLVGVARANMIDKLLVPDADRPLVVEQALSELRASVRDVRPEWQSTALSWISYLDALSETEVANTEQPAPPALQEDVLSPRRAAPPWEPDSFPWGPVLLGGSGALLLTAALITDLEASHLDSELDHASRACMNPCRYTPPSLLQLARDRDTTSTLFTVTDVLLVAGAASLTGAVLWYALRHTPSDPPPEIAVVPWLRGGGAGIQTVGRF